MKLELIIAGAQWHTKEYLHGYSSSLLQEYIPGIHLSVADRIAKVIEKGTYTAEQIIDALYSESNCIINKKYILSQDKIAQNQLHKFALVLASTLSTSKSPDVKKISDRIFADYPNARELLARLLAMHFVCNSLRVDLHRPQSHMHGPQDVARHWDMKTNNSSSKDKQKTNYMFGPSYCASVKEIDFVSAKQQANLMISEIVYGSIRTDLIWPYISRLKTEQSSLLHALKERIQITLTETKPPLAQHKKANMQDLEKRIDELLGIPRKAPVCSDYSVVSSDIGPKKLAASATLSRASITPGATVPSAGVR